RIGSRVHLDQVDETPAVNLGTGRAYPTGDRCHTYLAVERFGQNASDGRLSHAAGARKQISMMQALLFKCIGKRPDHMILSGQFRKVLWPPFAGENLSLGHNIAWIKRWVIQAEWDG